MVPSETTDETTDTAFVWVWLPDKSDPVVAGRLQRDGTTLAFTYEQSYLDRPDAVALYAPELPLRPGLQRPDPDREAHGCIRDAAPDTWGRRVILAQQLGQLPADADIGQLDFLTCLLASGSNRIGALDFQPSADEYVPRTLEQQPPLNELIDAADALEAGERLAPALAETLVRLTAVGGAHPKVLTDASGREVIAKWATATETFPIAQGEAIAMQLAAAASLDVPPVELVWAGDRPVLLVDRFDRRPGGNRRMMVSALTLHDLKRSMGKYASYPTFADIIRERFVDPDRALRELFARIVFNVIVGNLDDHAQNHAAFWDGESLTLTPAYDVCPDPKAIGPVEQSFAIDRNGDRRSRLQVCEQAADAYGLTRPEARDIIEHQLAVVRDGWDAAAERVGLDETAREKLLGGPFLNPAIFDTD